MNAVHAEREEKGIAASGRDHYAAACAQYYAGDLDAAESNLEQVVAGRPRDIDALYLLARTKWKKCDLKGALKTFQSLLSLKPDYASVLSDIALILLEGLNDPESAEKFSRRAVAADPLFAPGFVILGNSQQARGDPESASASYREALGINPRLPDPLVNLGVLAHEKGDIGGALRFYEQALRIDSSHANAHWNRGNALLALGRLEEGWKEYEYRFRIRGANASHRDPERAAAHWDGSQFGGKRLLVYSEQGFGDTIQFVRYIPLVKDRGGTVILECQGELAGLLEGFPGIDEIVSGETPVSPSRYDFAVPLLSLPGIFSTTRGRIPWAGPYIAPDPERAAAWRSRFDPRAINVGIVWQGSRRHRNDARRSCRLEDLLTLAGLQGVQLYSLQKHREAEAFPLPPGVIDLGGELDDFSVTAAVISHLDLLVTVDTAAAHLAGALGKPVWVLLPFVPDWRWEMQREDSSWYPSMRLFRQNAAGDWSRVLERVAAEIPSIRKANDASALFERATLLFRSGDLPGAEEGLRATVHADPADASAHNALGFVLTFRGSLAEASAELLAAVTLDPGNAEAHYNLGNVRLRQSLYRDAELSYRAAIDIAPDFIEARINLGNALREEGDPKGALAELREALAFDPASTLVLKQIGSICMLLHDEEGALQAFESALRSDPEDADIHLNLGLIRKSRGALDEAVSSFERAIAVRPELAEAHSGLGTVLQLQGKVDEALRCFSRAVEIQPDAAPLHAQLGIALMGKGDTAGAFSAFRNALRLKPDFPEVLNNMGMLLKERGNLNVAEKFYRIAIRVRPEYPHAHNNLGSLLTEKSLFTEAESHCRRALELKPDFHLARNNLANALGGQGRFEEAERLYRETIAADPSIPEVHFNLAAALANGHRFDESIRSYDDAIRARPGYAEAHLNRSLICLLTGNLAEGWAGYEWRFKVCDPLRKCAPPDPDITRWDGSDLRGKKILVRSEQGFGDTLQFARFLPELGRRGGTVVFECHSELCGLFTGFPGIDTLVRMSHEPPSVRCDVFIQLLSLPGILGVRDVNSIPWAGPYIRADESLANEWRTRIRADRLSVGVVWAGNPVHRNDFNRSCPLESILPLLETPGVNFYSLQKGKHSAALESSRCAQRAENLDQLLTDFSQTAAAIENLDLVIAVDTAVAHLAGAMGKNVWTLLPFRPDWRWLVGRVDSPWYPGMRLFRQSRYGDWPGLISCVRGELIRLVESGVRPGRSLRAEEN